MHVRILLGVKMLTQKYESNSATFTAQVVIRRVAGACLSGIHSAMRRDAQTRATLEMLQSTFTTATEKYACLAAIVTMSISCKPSKVWSCTPLCCLIALRQQDVQRLSEHSSYSYSEVMLEQLLM